MDNVSMDDKNQLIYLDNNATSKVDPSVVQLMSEIMTSQYGNSSNRTSTMGKLANQIVEDSRTAIMSSIGARSTGSLFFVSGATESINLGLKGACQANRKKGKHIITNEAEHVAVLECCRFLERDGFDVQRLPVDENGVVDPNELRAAIRPDTIVASFMMANNETGAINPIDEIGRICHTNGVCLHCDATQAVGRIEFDIEQLDIDLLSFSAHKCHGPKGVGALYAREYRSGRSLVAQMHGGPHEFNLRPGTLNTPGIAGFAHAITMTTRTLSVEARRLEALRDRLEAGLSDIYGDVVFYSRGVPRLPNTTYVGIPRLDSGESFLQALPHVVASTSSACSSRGGSHVLAAMGVDRSLRERSIRFSLGRFTTASDIESALSQISRISISRA